MKTFKKTIIAIVIVGIVFMVLGFVFGNKKNLIVYERTNTEHTDSSRVFDMADVLTDDEEQSLQEYIEEKEKEISQDIVLITLDDLSIQNHDALKEYAETTFVQEGFGWNEPGGDGIIYVDNWAEGADKKYTWMACFGVAKERLSQNMTDDIVDDTCENVNHDTYGSYKLFVDETVKGVKRGRGLSIPWFVAPLLALVGAIGFIIYQVSVNAGVDTTSTDTYAKDGSFSLHKKEDIFIRSYVTSRKIEKDHDSGGGGSTSGSGGSH